MTAECLGAKHFPGISPTFFCREKKIKKTKISTLTTENRQLVDF